VNNYKTSTTATPLSLSARDSMESASTNEIAKRPTQQGRALLDSPVEWRPRQNLFKGMFGEGGDEDRS
jgi:hypothetical protein